MKQTYTLEKGFFGGSSMTFDYPPPDNIRLFCRDRVYDYQLQGTHYVCVHEAERQRMVFDLGHGLTPKAA